MTAPAAPEVQSSGGVALQRDTVVLQLEIATPSFHRKVNSKSIVEDKEIDASAIHASKELIDTSSSTYRAITTHASRFKSRFLRNRILPCGMLKSGMVVVPLGYVVEVDRGCKQFELERSKLVGELIKVFDGFKEQAQQRLGPLYNDTDYLPAEALAAKFAVRYRFWSFNVPAALKGVNTALFEREQARVEAEWKETAEEVKDALRGAFADLITHMTDRLVPGEDGKAKVFRGQSVENLKDFLETFATRNITGDNELGELVARAKALMSGVDVKALRKQDGGTRERVATGFAEIKAALEPLLTTRRRAFSFEDEEKKAEAGDAA